MYAVDTTRHRLLSENHCLPLLEYHQVGRLGFVADKRPRIYPLNSRLHGAGRRLGGGIRD